MGELYNYYEYENNMHIMQYFVITITIILSHKHKFAISFLLIIV
jgi:hypothetical protein